WAARVPRCFRTYCESFARSRPIRPGRYRPPAARVRHPRYLSRAIGSERETMTRDEILQRYRHLRAINARHNSAILGCVARPTLLENARRLGVAFGNTLVVDSEAEMALVFDLAIYTARGGR